MMTIRKALTSAALAAGVVLAPAVWSADDVKEIPLKDGGTLLIFKDGKMSHRDTRGRVMSMKEGVTMETKDGKVLVMKGNELWRRTTTEQVRDEMYQPGN